MFINREQKGQVKFAEQSTEVQNKVMLREACRAMIAHLLLDQKHKTTLKKIFKIMDDSGDGDLSSTELRIGF